MLRSCQEHSCLGTQRPAPVACAASTSGRCSSETAFRASCRLPQPHQCSNRAMLLVRVAAQQAGPEVLPPVSPPQPPSQELRAAAAGPQAKAAEADKAWKIATEARETGDVFEGRIQSINEGGVIVQLPNLRGFISYKQLEPARLTAAMGDMNKLVGQPIKAKVLSAEIKAGRKELILSERKVGLAEQLKNIKVGDVVSGTVTSMQDYGAFVQLNEYPDAFGMVHISHLSWDKVMRVDEVVQVGQKVEVKVLSVDQAKSRLSLSLREMTPDPLRQTKEELEWKEAASDPPAEITAIMSRLQQQEGVSSVQATMVAEAAHIASQDLEVYLTREEEDGGFNVVARLGTTLYQLKVVTTLPREALKEQLQNLTKA